MATRPEVDPTMWTSLLHAGLAGSFMGLPHIPPREPALREAGAGAAIYGLPFDSTCVGRSGANYGPRGIRVLSYHSSGPTARPSTSISARGCTRATAATARSYRAILSAPSSAPRPTSPRSSPRGRCR